MQKKKRETDIVLLRYRDGKTFQEIAEIYSRSDSRIAQKIHKVLRKFRHPVWMIYIVEGYQANYIRMIKEQDAYKLIHPEDCEERRREILQQSIEVLRLTIWSYNALKRGGINTLADLVEKSKDPEAFVRLRNFGKTSQVEVVSKMLDLGLIDASHPTASMISYGGNKNS